MKSLWTSVRILTLTSVTALSVMLILGSAPVHAAKATTFIALLNAGQEVPSGTSTAAGVAYLILGSDDMLCVALTFGGLTGTLTGAHIHGPDAAPRVNADILFPFPTSNPINTCVGPLNNAQKKDLRKGLLYLNVHSSVVPAGEIRGQIEPIRK
jgi:CHRD domain